MPPLTLFAATYIALRGGHTTADYLVLTDHQAAHKAGHGWAAVRAMTAHLIAHAICQAATLALVFATLGAPVDGVALTAALVLSVATHGLIDRRWPVRWLMEHTGSTGMVSRVDGGINGMYLTDQALHEVCTVAAALLYAALAG